jgi:hypothetical protein
MLEGSGRIPSLVGRQTKAVCKSDQPPLVQILSHLAAFAAFRFHPSDQPTQHHAPTPSVTPLATLMTAHLTSLLTITSGCLPASRQAHPTTARNTPIRRRVAGHTCYTVQLRQLGNIFGVTGTGFCLYQAYHAIRSRIGPDQP